MESETIFWNLVTRRKLVEDEGLVIKSERLAAVDEELVYSLYTRTYLRSLLRKTQFCELHRSSFVASTNRASVVRLASRQQLPQLGQWFTLRNCSQPSPYWVL